jgi:molecular chaperone DnaK
MTITGGTALSQDKIDQMIKDAEAYAEEDARRREAVETRNRADQLIHQTEKLVQEQGEQMTEEETTAINAALASLRESLESADTPAETIQSRMDELVQASQAMATRLYQQAAQAQATSEESDGPMDEEIVEAEIVDEDE